MAWHARLWLPALVIVLLGSTAASQSIDPAPPVEVEEAEVPGLVVPYSAPVEAQAEVRVGCEAHEVPSTTTHAILNASAMPDWVSVVVSPATLTWVTAPGDCPATGLPFEANTTIPVTTDQNAPAYAEQRLSLELLVVKDPPQEIEERTYGPYSANVTLTPGYYHLHSVVFEEVMQEVDRGGTAVFEGSVNNMANHETAYVIQADGPQASSAVEITAQPSRLVLSPNASGHIEIHVGSEEGSLVSSQTVDVEVMVDGNSTHPLGGEGATSIHSLRAVFPATVPNPGDGLSVTAPGLGLLIASLLVATAWIGRSRS